LPPDFFVRDNHLGGNRREAHGRRDVHLLIDESAIGAFPIQFVRFLAIALTVSTKQSKRRKDAGDAPAKVVSFTGCKPVPRSTLPKST
jgi:hypothetical protein